MGVKKMYLVVMMILTEDTLASEPMGIYSSFKRAMEQVVLCESKIDPEPDQGDSLVFFDVIDFELNRRAEFLDWKITTEELVKELLEKDMIDQLIGEDGEFYYILTEKGMEAGEQIKKMIPIFKKKDLEE